MKVPIGLGATTLSFVRLVARARREQGRILSGTLRPTAAAKRLPRRTRQGNVASPPGQRKVTIYSIGTCQHCSCLRFGIVGSCRLLRLLRLLRLCW